MLIDRWTIDTGHSGWWRGVVLELRGLHTREPSKNRKVLKDNRALPALLEVFLMAQFTVRESGDYIQVICPTCGEACEVDYLGLDPSIPLISITCQACKNSVKGKLDRAGSGFYEHTKDKGL